MYSSTRSTGRPASNHRCGSQRWYQRASYSTSGASAATKANASDTLVVSVKTFDFLIRGRLSAKLRNENAPATASRTHKAVTSEGRYPPAAARASKLVESSAHPTA